MRLDRFSMILYIAFPFMGAICSVIMVTHFLWIVQGGIEGIPFPEAAVYLDMVRNFSFSGAGHYSYHIVIPALVGVFTGLFGMTSIESIALIFGTCNFILFLIGAGLMMRIGINEQSANVFELVASPFLIVALPFFFSAAFLPLTDTGAFLGFSLILLALFYRNLGLLYMVVLFTVWINEAVLLALLVVPALNYIRRDNWWQAYIPFAVSGLIYVFAVIGLSDGSADHYILNSHKWMETVVSNFLQFDRHFFTLLFSSFGLTIFFIIYRFYRGGAQTVNKMALLLLITYYILFLLIAPEKTARLMFMVMPLLIFFNFNDKTIEELSLKY